MLQQEYTLLTGEYMKFGELFKDRRIALGKTLREFCEEHELDPGNISRLERGRMQPPQDIGLLKQYAKYLKIDEGTQLWHEFIDKAAAENGQIPKDILDDKEVIEKLPIFFRILRSKKLDRDKLKTLVEKIRPV